MIKTLPRFLRHPRLRDTNTNTNNPNNLETLCFYAQVQLRVDVSFVRDALKGDDATEMRIKFLGLMEDEAPPDDD